MADGGKPKVSTARETLDSKLVDIMSIWPLIMCNHLIVKLHALPTYAYTGMIIFQQRMRY